MGGFGNTRWNWYSKKTQVEGCSKLTISTFKPHLRPGFAGRFRWYRGERETGSISYTVRGNDAPTSIRFYYTSTRWSGEKVDIDYITRLTTTELSWGSVRYWFECLLSSCGRRVGCLCLPSGGSYFGCCHCSDLPYASSQEGNQYQSLFAMLAFQMQAQYPGLTWKDTRAMLDHKITPNLGCILAEKYLREWEDYDPYEGYLTAEQIQEQCGFSKTDLSRLEGVRLLMPGTKDGRYRPKLAGWGKKLAYLLGEGWEIDEIKQWSKERWKYKNPREWPHESVQ